MPRSNFKMADLWQKMARKSPKFEKNDTLMANFSKSIIVLALIFGVRVCIVVRFL